MADYTGGILPIQYESNLFIAGFSVVHNSYSSGDYKAWLHAEECSYYDGLKFEKRRLEFLTGRVAAKSAIARIHEIKDPSSFPINAGIFKFPVVKNIPNVQVSITHADKFAVSLAFPEEYPLGIDLEKIDDTKFDTIQAYNNETEAVLIYITSLPTGIGHTMLWTIKESLSKVLKTGLTISFELLAIETLTEENGHYTATFSNFHQYKALSYITSGYVCSIVLPLYSEVNLDPLWNGLDSVINL